MLHLKIIYKIICGLFLQKLSVWKVSLVESLESLEIIQASSDYKFCYIFHI